MLGVTMSRRKERYRPKVFESMGNSDDVSANIYMSMLMHENWKALTKNQQILYVYCKAQMYAEKRKQKPAVRQLNETEQKLLFTMNRTKYVNLYGLYSDGNRQSFVKDMQALIDYGFVDLIESNGHNFKKNIYMLSDNWRYKKP